MADESVGGCWYHCRMKISTPDGAPDVGFPRGRVLPEGFFERPSEVVAPDLIGKILWVQGVGGGRLTEVEAYLPKGDPASHAARGPTKRNAAMFGPPGCIYVFQSYGIHLLLNIVCDGVMVGSAVLLRSFEPVGDTTVLQRKRGIATGIGLSCGPGRVGKALGVHVGLNGLPLGPESGFFIVDDDARPRVRCATRVGISRGSELPLRYYMVESAYVST